MEILKPIDEFVSNDLTMGLVERNKKVYVNGGFIGSVKGSEIIRELLSLYDDIPFVKSDGELDQTTNVVRMAQYFAEQWNVVPKNAGEKIEFKPGCVLYPHDYFLSQEGFTYHHYCASWLDAYARKVWISFGRYKLVRFKRRKKITGGVLPLYEGEKMLFKISFGSRKVVSLIKLRSS